MGTLKGESTENYLEPVRRLVAMVDKDIDIESRRNHYQQKQHWQAINKNTFLK